MTTQELFSKTNLKDENTLQQAGNRVRQWLENQTRRRNHRKAMHELEEYPDYLLQDIGLEKRDFSVRSAFDSRLG
jgi:uncharacterized protein YjiS (DUF1127 family)